MIFRKMIRETAFSLARRDLAAFLEDHEEDLVLIFREEMQQLDDELPEENLFIDLKMVPLGETMLRAALRAIRRFLVEDTPQANASEALEETGLGALEEVSSP
ncbi:MAG: hypothetical protein ACP5HM_02805 [Anaerolineae bacterium]